MDDSIGQVADWLTAARRAVALTGAGLSTESGIPDFRSPGGVWEKFRPIQYQDFLDNHAARVEQWRYKGTTVPAMLAAQPNAGHRALADLEAAQKLTAVITQNIDSLHQKAGSRRVLELHGTNAETVCLQCQGRLPIAHALRQLEEGAEVPACPDCGGWLKPATISFGQSLPAAILAESIELTRDCDCFLALGSSLVVHPAASLAGLAKQHGAKLIIVNLGETPYDEIADVVIRAPLGATLAAVAARGRGETSTE